MHEPWQSITDGEQHACGHNRNLTATDFVGNRTCGKRGNQGDNHQHQAHGRNGGRGIFNTLTNVVLQNIQLVVENHVVAEQQQGTADKCQPEVASAFGRRTEAHDNTLEINLFLRHILAVLFLRPEDHGKHTGKTHSHTGRDEARELQGDELRTNNLTKSRTEQRTCRDKCGHGAAHIFRNTVRQRCDDRCDHHVQTDHGNAVADANAHTVRQNADEEQRNARNNAARCDPWRTTSEDRARTVRHVANHEVGNQRGQCRG